MSLPFRPQIDRLIAAFGANCLDFAPTRRLMNALYNHGGAAFRYFFVRRFDASPIRRPFGWKVRFMGKTWTMPVTPAYRLSWHVALSALHHEVEILRCCRIYLTRSSGPRVFFDVGANHGLMSYPFLAHGYHCVMFEPQDNCLEYLAAASAANGFKPVIAPCVLSDQGGELDFFVSPSTWFSSVSRTAVENAEPATRKTVAARTLDDYCRGTGTRPGLIKIDVEGHEWEVLRGGAKLLAESRPTIFVEIWHDQPNKPEIFRFLTGFGYTCFGVEMERLVKIPDVAGLDAFARNDFVFCADPQLLPFLV